MKLCFDCQRELPLTDFYKHPAMMDGHLNKCKDCVKNYQKRRRETNGDEIREYDRKRATLPHRVAARKAYVATEQGKERLAAGSVAWQERCRIKRAAHIAVGNAIRDGKLIKQPCETCGSPYVQGHHDDYTKPLEVAGSAYPATMLTTIKNEKRFATAPHN